jgi:hypothetical protein
MTRLPRLSRDRTVTVVLPILVALVAAGEAVSGKVGAPIWVYVAIPVAGLIGTATGLVLEQRQRESQEQEHQESTFKEHLRWPLPRISELRPNELGVEESQLARELGGFATPYVERVKDAELDDALATKPVVVIVGESGAGKSRTAPPHLDPTRSPCAENRWISRRGAETWTRGQTWSAKASPVAQRP